MAFKLSELYVEITGRDSALGKVFGGIHAKMSLLGALGLRAGQALGAGLWSGFNKASDLAETQSKVEQVFGASASIVQAYADDMAESFGVVKKEMLDAQAQFGLIAQGLGMSQQGSAQFSNAMAQLAADTASFFNLDMATALEKIRAGLTGEAEPLKALGVIMNETMVKQRAAAMGFKEVNGALSEQAKFAARASIINEGLAKASGDLARTSDSDANRMKAAMGRWENALTDMGAAVEPAFAAIINAAGNAVGAMATWFDQNRETVMGWAGAIGAVFDAVGFTFRNLGDIATVWGLQLQEKFINAGELANWLMDTLGKLGGWFADNWVNLIIDGVNALWVVWQNVFQNIRDLVQASWDFINGKGFNFNPTPILEGFKSTVAALPGITAPTLTSLEDQIATVYEKIGAREADLSAAQKKRMDDLIEKQKLSKEEALRQVAAEMLAADQGRTGTNAKAEKTATVGLEDFAKKLQEGVFGKDRVQREQLQEQRRTRTAVEMMAARAASGIAVGLAVP